MWESILGVVGDCCGMIVGSLITRLTRKSLPSSLHLSFNGDFLALILYYLFWLNFNLELCQFPGHMFLELDGTN